MLAKLLGRPYLNVKKLFLGVIEPKCCIFSLRFIKIDKDLLQDVINSYDHFMSYIFWYSKHKHVNNFFKLTKNL